MRTGGRVKMLKQVGCWLGAGARNAEGAGKPLDPKYLGGHGREAVSIDQDYECASQLTKAIA